jgi:hypothetical protein
MTFRGRWWRRLDATCVITIHTVQESVRAAVSYSAGSVKSSWNQLRTSSLIQRTSRWNLQKCLLKKETCSNRNYKRRPGRQGIPNTAQIVTHQISWKRSTIFCRTVLTSVNFLIGASRILNTGLLIGRPCESCSSMQSLTALNLVVIYVITKISSIWPEQSYSNISKENVPR